MTWKTIRLWIYLKLVYCNNKQSLKKMRFFMKKYLPVLIVMIGFCLFVAPQKAFALTCTWNGGTSAFATTTNWNNCGGHAPTSSDTATFDGAVSNVSSSSSGTNISVLGVNFTGSYSGTLTQTTTDTITVDSSGWTQPTG